MTARPSSPARSRRACAVAGAGRIYIYIYIVHDSASVESTRGGSLVACQNGSVPEWLSRSSGPGNKRGVIVTFSAPLGTVHACMT